MRGTPWLRLGLRLIVVYTILSVLPVVWERYYVEWLLPLYHAVVAALGPEYLIGPLSITPLPTGEPVISSEITTRQAFLLGGGMVPADLPITASTLMGHALQHPTLLFAVGLAWRLVSAVQRAVPKAATSTRHGPRSRRRRHQPQPHPEALSVAARQRRTS